MKSQKKHLTLLIAAIGAGAVTAPQVFAAQAGSNVLEEVVVTAQKRDETLQDVPITITALSADKLEKSNFSSVNDLPALVPALRIDAAGAFSQPTVRGVGSSIAGVGFSSNIATYVDGFYIPSQLTTNMQLLNLQNVEVLKGPQGTLFGRNATGGAILLTMLEPSQEPTAKIKASYGSNDHSNVQVYGSSSVTDSLVADVSGYWEKSDGWVKNIYTGSNDDAAFERRGVRVSSVWTASDTMSFKLALDHHDWDDNSAIATSALDGQSSATNVPWSFVFPGAIATSRPNRVSNDGDTAFSAQIDGAYLTSRFDLGGMELVSYTMGRRESSKSILDLDSSSAPMFHNFFDIKNDAFSQEFNLSGTAIDDKLDWIVGLYYLNVDEDYTDLEGLATGFGVPSFVSLYNVAATIRTSAIFTDMTYNITDDWMLTLGARYSTEDADGLINIHSGGPSLLGPVPVGKSYPHDSWSKFTPRAVLAYKPSAEQKIYFSVSKGFKAGQIAPSSLDPTVSVNPENITAYELGYKYADSQFRFDASTFYYDYKDMQVASYNGVAAIVTNAASSTVYGAETQIALVLTDELTLNVGAAYVHGEYDDYPGAPFFRPTNAADVAAGGVPGIYTSSPGINAGGLQMQRSPRFTGNIGLQYDLPTAEMGTFRVNGDYYYTSKFYFDVANQYKQDGYGLLNMMVSWIDPSDKWTLSLYGKNLTNETYRTQVLAGSFAIQQTYGEPANYGVSAAYKF